MKESFIDEVVEIWQRTKHRLRRAPVYAWRALRALWGVISPPLGFALQVLLALVLLFEEWGWRPLAAALAWLARFRLWARVELFIAGLPPYGALLALALPTSVLFPLKLLSIYLLSNGQLFAAGLLFVGAKIASTALIARLLLLTKPALMRIPWFAAIYNWFMPWKEALFEQIRQSWAWRYGRMIKTRIRLETKQAWMRLKPGLEQLAMRMRLTLRRMFGRA